MPTVATKNEPAPIDPLDDTLETFQKRPWLEWAILLVLCLVMLSQLLLSVSKLSQTEDEAVHLYSGYRYLQCGDLTFSPEHPPLAKMIAACNASEET